MSHPCTCHPDDIRPEPCPQRYAYGECVKAAFDERAKLRATLRPCIEIIEANVEFDDEIHQIVNEARRALSEGK
jgi:hypothetical protein